MHETEDYPLVSYLSLFQVSMKFSSFNSEQTKDNVHAMSLSFCCKEYDAMLVKRSLHQRCGRHVTIKIVHDESSQIFKHRNICIIVLANSWKYSSF